MNPFKKTIINSNAIVVSTFKNQQALASIVCNIDNLAQTLEHLMEAKGDTVIFTVLEDQVYRYKLPLSKNDSNISLETITSQFHSFISWK